VIAEGWDALAVEDTIHAKFQLFLMRKALGGNELEDFAGDIPPLVYLFGKSGSGMSVLPEPAAGSRLARGCPGSLGLADQSKC
jgi:hypothetical protein